MALPTIYGVVELPAGLPGSQVEAHLDLVAAVDRTALGHAAVAAVGNATRVRLDPTGRFEFAGVRPNSGAAPDAITSPSGTVYRLRIAFPDGTVTTDYLDVPDQSGSINFSTILAVAPDAIVDSAVEQAIAETAVDTATFTDTFDRPDGAIGNGWTDGSTITPDDQDPLAILDGSVVAASLAGAADQTGTGATTGWRAVAWRPTGLTGGFEVTVTWTGEDHDACGGPAAFFAPHDPDHSVGGGYNPALTAHEFGYLGARQTDFRYADLNFAGPHTEGVPLTYRLRSSNGTDLAMFLDTDSTEGGLRLVAGPVMVPEALRHSGRHGFWLDYLADTVASLGATNIDSFSIAPWSGTLPTYEAASVESTAAAAKSASVSTIAADYPASPTAGRTLVAVVCGASGGTWSGTGWTVVAQSGIASGLQVAVLRRTATGSETGSATFTKTGGSAGTAAAVILEVADLNQHTPLVAAHATTSSSSTTANGPSLSVLGQHRRSLWLCFTGADVTVTPPTGFTELAKTGAGGAACTLYVGQKEWDADFPGPFGSFVGTSFVPSATGETDGTLSSSTTSVVCHLMLEPDPTVAGGADWTPDPETTLGAVVDDLAAHLADTVDAHDASAISYAGGTGMSATDVESAIDELAGEKLDKAGGTMTGDLVVNDGTGGKTQIVHNSGVPAVELYTGANDANPAVGLGVVSSFPGLGAGLGGASTLSAFLLLIAGKWNTLSTQLTIPNAAADTDALNRITADDRYDRPAKTGPTSTVGASFPRHGVALANTTVLSSGRVSMIAVYYGAGAVVTNIGFLSATTAAASPTNYWFFIADSSRVVRAISADQLTAAWAANSAKLLVMGSAYTIPTSGLYYHGIMFAGTTAPTLAAVTNLSAAVGLAPILSGTSNTGMTTPPSVGTTMNALTSQAAQAYTWAT